MLRVFVCDEDESFHKDIGGMLEEHLKKSVKCYEITHFMSPDDLLQANYEQCDLFCLDVVFTNHMNGIELAKIIRKKNYKAYIIFVSSDFETAYTVFEVDTFRYLLKPIQKHQLESALDILLKKRKEQISKLITLQQGQKYFRIPYTEILYFETEDRKLHTVTVNKEYMMDNKINDLDQQAVDLNFFRIHKSYLINLAYVKEYDQISVTMQNGAVLFMSRLRIKEFKENYLRFLKQEKVAK